MLLGCLKIGEKRNGDLMNTWLLYYPEHQLHGETRGHQGNITHGQTRASGHVLRHFKHTQFTAAEFPMGIFQGDFKFLYFLRG